jgi:2-oxoglutarate dehydrogenase E2 component (dihydrolipoamide succinyltransferase)
MVVDVVMPKMGESITEGTVLEWYKKVGESIEKDETLLEIGTDKVDSEIPSPESGIISEILAEPNDIVDVGNIIARIETSGKIQKENKLEKVTPIKEKKVEKSVEKTAEASSEKNIKNQKRENIVIRTIQDSNSAIFTPAVMKVASQRGISLSELEMINGTGANGRVTKKDLQNYIASDEDSNLKPIKKQSIKPELLQNIQSGEKVQLDHMRRMISEHMRYSLDTSAHVYIMNEVDMTNIVDYVKEKEGAFFSEENFKLTYTPFIIIATVNALKEMPEMNSSLDGDSIIYHNSINVGIAVSVDGGLMVPSIFNCDEKNLLGICRDLNEIVNRTRKKSISPDELQGSTFTISNFGVFDATIGTPIINQPNVGVLGTGLIKKQPIVIEREGSDIIAIRSMMMLSLGFDHRLIDGAGGATFIAKIKENLENMNLKDLI